MHVLLDFRFKVTNTKSVNMTCETGRWTWINPEGDVEEKLPDNCDQICQDDPPNPGAKCYL